MTRSVTITGTRSTGHRGLDSYAELFTNYLTPFADIETRFYIGGANGIDSLSLLWLAENTHAQITIVVPGTTRQQPAEAQHAITHTRDRITEVVELHAAELDSPAFHARNRWMVDHSDMVIGFPLPGPQGRSGTWQTLNYGAEQGKPHLVVPV
ncbi:DNA-processing protein DprA [Streptomyces sp. NBRC 110028]|uniref:DNA-processing protein DprA n=1 Tax=Streptomyces sp. NBRC 110028 TaxID=1621260 RepID=UPI0006E21EC5|nr:DNA-processing protein DprA [Streptomyces sp. NBRC 110028]